MKTVRKILKNLSGLFLLVGIGILIEVNATAKQVAFVCICLGIGYVCILGFLLLYVVLMYVFIWFAMILLVSYYNLVDKWKEIREKNPKNLTIKKDIDLKIAKPI